MGKIVRELRVSLPPTGKDPYWKIIFDGKIIFAAGKVKIYLRDRVESNVDIVESIVDILPSRKLRLD